MAGAVRFVPLLVLALFVYLVVAYPEQVLLFLGILLLVIVLSGALFYVRIRLAVRRFRNAWRKAESERAAAANRAKGDVVDAEFKVKDE